MKHRSKLTKWVKVQHEKKPALSFKSMQNVVFEQRTILLRFWFHKSNFFKGKKTVVETLSVAINDSFDVLYFNLYLINKLGRYTIYKGSKMQRRYVQTDTLLFIYSY